MAEKDKNFFLGRQPILGPKKEIAGYELLFRAADEDNAIFNSNSQASAAVITNALASFGINEVLGDKLGFINVDIDLLMSETVELLPADQIVLELLETIPLNEEVIKRCAELKKMGFTLALDDHQIDDANYNIYNYIDIVKLDVLSTDTNELKNIAKKLRKYPVSLLAEKVETIQQFQICRKLGFEFFQGYFFARPVVLKGKSIDVSHVALFRLLQQLTLDAKFSYLEKLFKENPSLSFKLLKLVNSVSIGLREKIKTLRHALVILGINNLRRWIKLSLYTNHDSRSANNPLVEMAAVRGRLMEILLKEITGCKLGSEQAEAAFMVGLLSLLDVLFETPMSEMIPNLNLDDNVSEALLSKGGQLGKLLILTEKLELSDFDTVKLLLNEFSISIDRLLSAQLQAFNWRTAIVRKSDN